MGVIIGFMNRSASPSKGAKCQWETCTTWLPGSAYMTKYPSSIQWQRKYCDLHRPLRFAQVARGRRKPERYTARDGYIYVYTEEQGRVAEHRLLLEQLLGRPLRRGESVHHINGIRDDNRPENLELWVGAIRYGQRATEVLCNKCGTPYAIEEHSPTGERIRITAP